MAIIPIFGVKECIAHFLSGRREWIEFDIEHLVELVSIDSSDIKDRTKVICKYQKLKVFSFVLA